MADGRTGERGFSILIDAGTIERRIDALARELASAGAREPHFLCVLDGGRVFAERLCRASGLPPGSFDTIKLSSYGNGTVSSGRVRIVKDLERDVRGRRVVVLEDIVDTGRTLAFLTRHLLEQGAASVEVCCLLDKPSRRAVDVRVDYRGFEIPDVFVIGFGMDVDGRFRDLPYIAVYDPAADRLAGARERS